MKRREFIAGLGAVATWSVVARAQQGVLTVGYLFVGAQGMAFEYTADFRKGLAEMGFVEGRNLAIEYRYADFAYNRLPALATELVRRRVAAIWAAGGGIVASAAKSATSTIPIVFAIGDDPVDAGLVASFNRPGGNVTGISFISELTAKRFGLLHDLLPTAKHFAVFADAGNPRVEDRIAVARVAASAIGGQIEVFAVANAGEIDAAFASIVAGRAEALLIVPAPLFLARAPQIATLATRHGIPTIHFARDFVQAGGLISYGPSIPDAVRQSGIYVGRVLKGEKPADLPVMQPTKFNFVINMTTAKAFGLTIPPNLLALADEVIE